MRKLDNIATGFGILAILVPVIITVALTAVSYSIGATGGNIGVNLIFPTNYSNMTQSERLDYLIAIHGGVPTESDHKEWWSPIASPFVKDYTFPDGTFMDNNAYNKFINGEAGTVDYMSIVLSCLSINPLLLSYLGIFGIFYRVILIISISLGFVELIWIG